MIDEYHGLLKPLLGSSGACFKHPVHNLIISQPKRRHYHLRMPAFHWGTKVSSGGAG